MEFYIAQGISILATVTVIMTMQFKSMKHILLGQILANLLSGSTFLLLGGFSGSGVCFIAIAQSAAMFLYERKNKKPHPAVITGFIALYIGCSAYCYQSFVDIFSCLGAISFAISIAQKKPSVSRLWYLLNPVFWMVYSISTRAYGNIIMHVLVFTSTAAAILRNDLPQLRKKQS